MGQKSVLRYIVDDIDTSDIFESDVVMAESSGEDDGEYLWEGDL
jgi:hypothetical protein